MKTDLEQNLEYNKIFQQAANEMIEHKDWGNLLVKNGLGEVMRIGLYTLRFRSKFKGLYYDYLASESETKPVGLIKLGLTQLIARKLKNKRIKLVDPDEYIDLDELKAFAISAVTERKDRWTKGAVIYLEVYEGKTKLKMSSLDKFNPNDMANIPAMYLPVVDEMCAENSEEGLLKSIETIAYKK